MDIQVIAFMKPHKCRATGEVIFFSLYSAMVQKGSENGIFIKNGTIKEIDRPLDQKKINDVVSLFEQHKASNTTVNKELLREHPFCTENFRTDTEINEFIYLSDEKEAPKSLADVWLRHFLVSMMLTPINFWNLEGQFGILPNIAWLPKRKMVLVDHANEYLFNGGDSPYSVDKFPRLTDWWIPPGVRIADAQRVRLGAQLASGTTVMHEGFVDFNAGTLGSSMVEGRISAGTVVGDGSDIGVGASIMGTLSGGGTQVISMGQCNLLGANAGLGISLGDDCVVEAGLYLAAGTKVKLPDGSIVLACELSGQSGLLFRRHSQTGVVEAIVLHGSSWGGLNTALHAND